MRTVAMNVLFWLSVGFALVAFWYAVGWVLLTLLSGM